MTFKEKTKLMFKNYFIFILLLLFLNKAGKSQQTDTAQANLKNSIYLELGGQGTLYSVNYERRVWNNSNWAVHFHSGISYFYLLKDYGEKLQMPISIRLLYGSKSSKIEAGLGAVVIYDFYPYPKTKKGREELRQSPDRDALTITPPVYVYTTPFIGYRYQANNGFLFRANFTPIIVAYFYYHKRINAYPWGGISLGYSFNG